MKFEKKLVLFTLFATNLVDQPAPEVNIEQGILSGIVSADGSILEYIGIPYATTTSETRFKVSLLRFNQALGCLLSTTSINFNL